MYIYYKLFFFFRARCRVSCDGSKAKKSEKFFKRRKKEKRKNIETKQEEEENVNTFPLYTRLKKDVQV